MTKNETRAVAAELGLRTATKPDSQEICFVRQGDVAAYLSRSIPAASRPGPIVDRAGDVVGEHRGAARYTVGQRKGVGVSLGMPVFVTSVDVEANVVTVGSRNDLAIRAIELTDANFVTEVGRGAKVLVQYRAHGEVHPARVTSIAGGRVDLELDEAVEAVASGQSGVLYSVEQPDEMLGGGVIASTTPARAVA